PPMPPPSPYTTLFRSRIRLPIERLRRSRRALPYVRPLSTTGHRVHRSFVCHHITSHSKQGRGGTSKCPAPPSPSRMRVMAEPLSFVWLSSSAVNCQGNESEVAMVSF